MAENLVDREVNEIPVVRLLSVLQIKCQDLVAAFDGILIAL